MNRNKPHSLDLEMSYEIGNKKVKLGNSKLEGWIILKDKRETIRLPMRSFVLNFLRILYSHFTANTTGYARSWFASIGSGTATLSSLAGLVLGDSVTETILDITASGLKSKVRQATRCYYGNHQLQLPYEITTSSGKFKVKRTIYNNSATDWNITESGLYGCANTASKNSVAASNSLKKLITYDRHNKTFEANTTLTFNMDFLINNSFSGGLVMNMLRVIYNTCINTANSAKLQNYLTGAQQTLTALNAPYALDADAGKLFGIVLGQYDVEGGIVSLSSYANGEVPDWEPGITIGTNIMYPKTTGLTYGAMSVGAVTTETSNIGSITLSRTITNSGSTVLAFNRVGLLIEGDTTDPTSPATDQCFLAINGLNDDLGVLHLQPSQSIKITYRLYVDNTTVEK